MPQPPPGFELDPLNNLPEGFVADAENEPWAEKEATFKDKMAQYGQELAHQLGLTARWGAEGVAGAVGSLSDPLGEMMASVMNQRYEPLSQYVSKKLTEIGVPEPRNKAEEIVGDITKLMAGAGTMAGGAGALAKGATGLTKQVAGALASQPGQQIAGAAGAGAGQEVAKEAGAGPVGQVAANIAGGVVGAGLAGAPRMSVAPKELPPGLAEAEKSGIRTFTSDVIKPKTSGGKTLQRTFEKVLGGTGPQKAAQQEERIAAAKDFVMQYGGEETLPVLDKVYNELKQKRGFKLGKYTKLKKDVINKLNDKGAVPVGNTINKIDENIAALKSQSPSGENDALINQFENFKTDIQNQGLINIEEARKRLGDRLAKDPSLAHIKDAGEKMAGPLYKQLNEDMGGFIKNVGEPKDFNKWKAGNAKLAQMAGELKFGALKSTLRDGEATPETVKKLIFSKKPSELRLLYKNLTPAGKRNAKTALMQEAVEKAGGIEDLSPDRFKNQLKRLNTQTGVFFTKEDADAVSGIYRALKFTEGAGQGVAAPRTGEQAIQILTVMLGGAGGSYAGGAPGAALGAVAVPITIGGISRIYNSQAVKNSLIQLARVKKGSPEEARLVKRLYTVVQSEYDKQENKP